jgi:hypothetical protein
MPKVTLLGSPGRTYIFFYGGRKISFAAGKEAIVPLAIAEQLRHKKTGAGKPVFLVEKLPAYAEPELPEVLNHPNLLEDSNQQNVSVGRTRQMRFGSWS